MSKKSVIIFLLCAASYSHVLAQVFVNDAALWIGLSAEKKINRILTPHIKGVIRQAENFQLLKQYFIDFGMDIALNQRLRLTIDYVYSPSRKDFSQGFRTFHQFYSALSYRQKINQRFRLDSKTTLMKTSSFLLKYNNYKLRDVLVLREKLSIRYKLSRRKSLYVADEVLYPVSNTPDYFLRRNRIFIGLINKINKSLSVDVYFLLQRRYNIPDEPTLSSDYVYGLTLDYTL